MKKRNHIFRAVALLLIMVAVLAITGCGKKDGYRLIQVYQVNGEATIEREKVGSMDAYENLNLLSGDWLSVFTDSFLRLKLDEDKYMLVEEDSEISIYATGDDKKSTTDIQLEKGSITVEVQNKLNDESSFEVTTPNSVMAIRGTVFRISADVDENGKPVTVVTILEGSVTVQKKNEKGEVFEEQAIEAGQEAIIYIDQDDVQLTILNEISSENISLQSLEFLQDVADGGRELCYTSEELSVLIEEREEEGLADTAVESTEETEDTEAIEDAENTEEEDSDVSGDADDSENMDDDGADTEEPMPPTEEPAPSIEEPVPPANTESTGTAQKLIYTVIFQYQGNTFAIQKVEEGNPATVPTLKPAPTGRWDFDFNTIITGDTLIEFVE